MALVYSTALISQSVRHCDATSVQIMHCMHNVTSRLCHLHVDIVEPVQPVSVKLPAAELDFTM